MQDLTSPTPIEIDSPFTNRKRSFSEVEDIDLCISKAKSHCSDISSARDSSIEMISSLFDNLKSILQIKAEKKINAIEECKAGIVQLMDNIILTTSKENTNINDILLNNNCSLFGNISSLISNKIDEAVSRITNTSPLPTNSTNSNEPSKMNYASVLKTSTNPLIISQEPKETIFLKQTLPKIQTTTPFHVGIKSIDPLSNLNSVEILELVKPVINPSKLGIKITGINYRCKNKIVIHVDSLKNQKTLYNEINKHSKTTFSKFSIYQGGPTSSKVTILKVNMNTSDDEILSGVSDLVNPYFDASLLSEIKIVRRTSPLSSKINILLNVPREIGKHLLTIGRIFFNFEGCRIAEGIYAKQCYNCLSYNHMGSTCQTSPVCKFCSGSHKSTSCTSPSDTLNLKCINCIREKQDNFNHLATSFSCPIFKEHNELAKTRYQHE
jgi:hypothetical protein